MNNGLPEINDATTLSSSYDTITSVTFYISKEVEDTFTLTLRLIQSHKNIFKQKNYFIFQRTRYSE